VLKDGLWTGEGVFRARDGRGTPVWRTVLAPRGAEGEPETLAVIARDITAQKLAEKTLRESEDIFHSTFDEAPIGIAHATLDRHWLRVNSRLCEMLGYSREELLGNSVFDVVHAVDPSSDRELLARLLSGEIRSYEQETRFRHKSGSDRWAKIRVVLRRDADGRPDHLIGVIEDITSRKQSQKLGAAFRELGLQLNTLASPEEAAVAVLVVADELIGWDSSWLELWEPGSQTSYIAVAFDLIDGTRCQVPGLRASARISPAGQRAAEDGAFLMLREPGEALATFRFGDASRPSASLLIAPIRSHERVIGALSIQSYEFHTYTCESLEIAQKLADFCGGALERTHTEARRPMLSIFCACRSSSSNSCRLAGGLAHEFNNMLAVINGYAELLLRQGGLSQSCTDHLNRIHHTGDLAARLTQQLLALGRKQVVSSRVVDLNEVISRSSQTIRAILGEGIHLTVRCDPALPRVLADRSQLEQVLTYLAANARDAMPEGGQLTIETRAAEFLSGAVAPLAQGSITEMGERSCALMTVSDTGRGMDAETLTHVFEPFFTTTDTDGGAGLGLATVNEIVGQCGGRVEVDSRQSGPDDTGSGASFRVYLPACAASPTPNRTITPTDSGIAPEASGLETVLLVEDEDLVRRLTGAILEIHGFRVLATAGGEEALQLAKTHAGPIHILLTDVVMPGGINGSTLAGRLKEALPDLRVVFMSGYSEEAVRRETRVLPGATFLQKPFSAAELAKTVRAALGDVTKS